MKDRLDKTLLRRNFFDSREKAQAYILGGNVSVDGVTVRKPAQLVSEEADIRLVRRSGGYVSRGGLKLEGALDVFPLDPRGACCLDIGASTGGFTDCLLKKGARAVIALDVGKNQLAYSLRIDPRVRVVEGFNARWIERLRLEEPLDLVTVDVSFISITRILGGLGRVIGEDCDVIALVKPQFELERPYKGFRGVVKEPDVHREVLGRLFSFLASEGYAAGGLTFSKVLGPKGNIEFFVWIRKGEAREGWTPAGEGGGEGGIKGIVAEAHAFFALEGGRK
jgi:23S rRNA (cytidine1920-2'-O)/16S rRNA (cytidine1409-2'-O)-methyltransferase